MKLYKTFMENSNSYKEYLNMLFYGDFEEIEVENIKKTKLNNYEDILINKLDKLSIQNNEVDVYRIYNPNNAERYFYARIEDGKIKTVYFDEKQLNNRESLIQLEDAKIDQMEWEVTISLEVEFYKEKFLHPLKFHKLLDRYISDEISSYKDINDLFEDDEKAKTIFNVINKAELSAGTNIDYDELIENEIFKQNSFEDNDLEENLER